MAGARTKRKKLGKLPRTRARPVPTVTVEQLKKQLSEKVQNCEMGVETDEAYTDKAGDSSDARSPRPKKARLTRRAVVSLSPSRMRSRSNSLRRPRSRKSTSDQKRGYTRERSRSPVVVSSDSSAPPSTERAQAKVVSVASKNPNPLAPEQQSREELQSAAQMSDVQDQDDLLLVDEEKESRVKATPPMPASSDDVVYLNEVRDKYSWNDQKVRREMSRVFPDLECSAKCIANGGIMFYGFKFETDVAMVNSFDWNSEIDGVLPFGGGCKTRCTKLTLIHVVNSTVRLVVPESSTPDWVAERCVEEGFGNCIVSQVGAIWNGKRVLKIELENEHLANRMTRDGISLAMNEKVSVPIPWYMYNSTKLCRSCCRNHDPRVRCRIPPRCAFCSRNHRGKCKEWDGPKCPNCSLAHSAHSMRCRYKHNLFRACAERTGLPLPRFVRLNQFDVKPSYVEKGKSYASAIHARPIARGSQLSGAPEEPGSHAPTRSPIQPQQAGGLGEVRHGPQQREEIPRATSYVARHEVKEIVENSLSSHTEIIVAALTAVVEALKEISPVVAHPTPPHPDRSSAPKPGPIPQDSARAQAIARSNKSESSQASSNNRTSSLHQHEEAHAHDPSISSEHQPGIVKAINSLLALLQNISVQNG